MESSPARLDSVIEQGLRQGPPELPEGFIDTLRSDLEAAARAAVDVALPAPDGGPIRLQKRRISDLLACERHALAAAHTEPEVGEALVRGSLLDALAVHHVLGGHHSDDALELGQQLLEARALDEPATRPQVEWLQRLSAPGRASLREELEAATGRLREQWPSPSYWHPRVAESVTAVLADGDVVISGRLDICLGGSHVDLPTVSLEVKAGHARQEFRFDHLLYALLLTLRDDVAPAAVATYTAADGGVLDDVVTADGLQSATKRVVHALDVAGRLASGATPTERPGWRCGYCPDNSRCPSAFEFRDDVIESW